MYNWSVNTKRLKKTNDQFEIYSLEQAINFGLNGTKLSLTALKKHWPHLNLDSAKKNYLSNLVWPKS